MSFKLNALAGFVISNESEAVAKEVAHQIATILGDYNLGATILPGQGYWQPTNAWDHSFFVYSACEDELAASRLLFDAWPQVQVWAEDTDQDAVAVIHTGFTLEIVDHSEYNTWRETLPVGWEVPA